MVLRSVVFLVQTSAVSMLLGVVQAMLVARLVVGVNPVVVVSEASLVALEALVATARMVMV